MKIIKTIIIGAGISGLACAHKLKKENCHFKIITENIGGRIEHSKKGRVNYGAYYIMNNYHHVKKFTKKTRLITPSKIHFHKRKHSYKILSFKFLKNLPQFIKLYFLLRKFKKHYEKFKIDCEKNSQAKTLKKDQYLLNLYTQKASDFVKEHKIEKLVEGYVSEVLHGTTFLPIQKLTAFTFLQFSLPIIIATYEIVFLKEKITKPFEKNIILDTATKIIENKNSHTIRTKKGQYEAENIVVATPPHISQKLLSIPSIKKPVKVHMFHIKGKLHEKWKNCEENLFSNKNSMLAIAHQLDRSYLFYSTGGKPQFKDYFSKYKIIRRKFWNPAFNLEGSELLECKQGKNLYLIGDHNVCGLEDSFITGIYAANCVTSS